MDLTGSVTIRSRMGTIGFWLVCGLAGVLLVWELFTGSLGAALKSLPLVGLLVLVTAMMWFWPRVRIDAAGIVVDNPLRRISVPWAALQEVSSSFGMTLRADGRKVSAWAAPVRSSARAEDRHQAVPTGLNGTHSTLDLDAHDAVRLIEQIRAERGNSTDPDEVRVQWHWARLGALLALLGLGTLVILP